MKKITYILLLSFLFYLPVSANETKNNIEQTKIVGIGFHKRTELSSEAQIRLVFDKYQKYVNNKSLNEFLNLHDDEYTSADGYNKSELKKLAMEAWNEYPDIKHTIKIISIDVDIDYATVYTQERLIGVTKNQIDLVKGDGLIDSRSTSIYYLKKCSNEWKITGDYVVMEKTALRYGLAKYIPMSIDAPGVMQPNKEYTAILKINTPRQYVTLVSINNEPITYPPQKSDEVFRALKSTGLQERILRSNDGSKNENAVASVGIAKPNVNENSLSVDLLGIAFLSSRVNVEATKVNTVEREGNN